MSALVIPFPGGDLREARAAVRYPDQHEAAVVLDACDRLEAYGDWIDVEQARLLRRAICDHAVDQINRRARRWRPALAIASAIGIAAGALFGLARGLASPRASQPIEEKDRLRHG